MMMIVNVSVHSLPDTIVARNSGEYVVPTLPAASLKSSTEAIMPGGPNKHQEAYYLYFVGILGMLLNLTVIICIVVRRTLRKMTSAFLIHCCFLNFVKAMFCIPFGSNLLSVDEPTSCALQGSAYIVINTASAFNLVAMICTEAYTFGETNIGGTSQGTLCCVLFGILTVYITSTILHLGPTLIGGNIEFNSRIGICTFKIGKASGYIAYVMMILIISLALICATHFLCKFYKEIQSNQPNRVSMLVRTSITIMDQPKQTASSIRELIEESSHRAKIFVMTAIMFVVCWYPFFCLILVDFTYKVSPKVYQTFSFIAWSQGTLEPILYILFDRKLNLLARFVYCDHYQRYNREHIASLMAQHRQPSRPNSSNVEHMMDHFDGDPNLSMDHQLAIDHRVPMDRNTSMDRSSTMERRIQCRHCRFEQERYDQDKFGQNRYEDRYDQEQDELDRQSRSQSSSMTRNEKGLPDSGHSMEVQC
ncbi:trace amine-associated receptor 4-like [Haliotis rufescens]|uniref:trace amine-associated receptor 4-like n=1 Tax=Haliotis rufescens TaxID=6454 RepID=UPI001EB03197|nr:trace amine-associated receptor 4-like [Haliotis rufescens]XP_046343066.1 trace amine-associated receptor 4-like [Haliotis rufescens]XP_046343067.1 trace amine-associated receptor 4-like [Haliotis rufescens]